MDIAMTQILSQPDSGGHGHGQWRRKTQALATQITERGAAKHGQWRHKPRIVATRNTGSGDTNHGQRRHETRAVVTQSTGSGDTKHRQWRHKSRAETTQNTGSGNTKKMGSSDTKRRQWRHKTRDTMCFRGPSDGGSSTVRAPHNELHLAYTHNGTTDINSILLDVLAVCEHSGFDAVQPGKFYTDKHTDSIYHSEDEGSIFFRSSVLSHQTP
jgi:hypothetical protein